MAYIYQADLWCDSCGRAICERLDKEGKTPDNPADERSYDSDDYPKYVGDPGESDCPDHCASLETCLEAETLPSGTKIGALLGTDLTSEGVEYVKEAIQRGGEVAEFWREQFAAYDLGDREEDDEYDDEDDEYIIRQRSNP